MADCGFSTHRSVKAKVDPSIFGDAPSVLLIQVPGKNKQRTAYIQPALSTAGLSDAILGNYCRQTRTIAEWQTVFRTVKDSVRLGAPASVMAKRSMSVGFSTEAITPRVKRHRYSDDSLEQDAESSSSSPFEDVDPRELPTELPGRTDAENFAAVISLWPNLVEGLSRARQGITDLDSGMKSFKVTVSDDIDELEGKIATDRTLIGRRPEEAGTASLWEAISELQTSVEQLGGVAATEGDSKPVAVVTGGLIWQQQLKEVQSNWAASLKLVEARVMHLETNIKEKITLTDASTMFTRRTRAMLDGALGRALQSMTDQLTSLESSSGLRTAPPSLGAARGLTQDEAEAYMVRGREGRRWQDKRVSIPSQELMTHLALRN